MRDIVRTPIGTMMDVVIWQSGRERTVGVEVRAWPDLVETGGATLAAKDTRSQPQSLDLGMLLVPVTDAARKRYAIGHLEGLVVVAIDNEFGSVRQGYHPGRCHREGPGYIGQYAA